MFSSVCRLLYFEICFSRLSNALRFAIAMDIFSLSDVCRNQIEGVAVRYVSPYRYVSLDSSCHIALTLCKRFCGEYASNTKALNENLVVVVEICEVFPRVVWLVQT
jgi:hypothetical protein